MAKRISRIEPWQTAKTLAGVYFILGLMLAVPLALLSPLLAEGSGEPQPGWGFIYNLVAARLGGVEFTVTDTQG